MRGGEEELKFQILHYIKSCYSKHISYQDQRWNLYINLKMINFTFIPKDFDIDLVPILHKLTLHKII